MASSAWKTLLPYKRGTKRIIADFADRVGLVYFGFVSQRSDEHHIIRGLTVSNKHVDDHYCIGTFEGYDVVFVERSDALRSGKKHVWHIMEFDLHASTDLPHAFVGSHQHGHGFHELLDVKFRSLTMTELGQTAQYDKSFTRNFFIKTAPENVVALERLISPEVAAKLTTHFKGLAIELTDTALYVYSEQVHLTQELLDTMLLNGTWLASAIDKNSRQL